MGGGTQLPIDGDRLHKLVNENPAILYIAHFDGDRPVLKWISGNVTRILGYGVDEIFQPKWWSSHLHPDDQAWFSEGALRESTTTDNVYRYRLRAADGTYRWMRDEHRILRDADGGHLEIFGSSIDETDLKTAEGTLASRGRILESLATEIDLAELLTELAREVEKMMPGTVCSILLLDDDRQHLRQIAAPSLPDHFNDAIDGLAVGPTSGCCGAAAYSGKPVIAEDTLTHPNWAAWHDLATRTGLRSCWSYPIIAASGDVLGTFALYRREPGTPDPHHAGFITASAHLAAIAIDHDRTTAALRLSEERFRDFAHAFGDRMWETDTEHRFTYISDPLPDGFSVSQLLGVRRWELSGPVTMASDWTPYRALVEKREPVRNFRYRWQKPDGSKCVYEINGRPVHDTHGRFMGYRGVTTDVTTEVRAVESAESAQGYLVRAVENLAELFTLCDAEDRIVMTNRAWRDINRQVADQIAPGRPFVDHLRAALARGLFPQAIGRENEWLEWRQSHRREPGGTFEIERQGGRWLLVNDERLPDGGLITISLDITERKQAELAMRDARDQAEAANRTKSQFLANMSHELRTPLNSIIGFSDLIRSSAGRDQAGETTASRAQSINEAGKHLLQLINDILDISKIEAGKFKLSDDLIQVADVVESSIRLIEQRAMASGITLDTDMPSNLPRLRADGRRIKQMLLNLLSNAIEHTPPGGRIAVRAAARDDRPGIVLEIADTGVGMAPEDIPKALTPFLQLESGFSRKTEGTGLGLALTKELVELHDGTFEIDSEPGAGTTVRITFGPDRAMAARPERLGV